jgi:hypothetical protein
MAGSVGLDDLLDDPRVSVTGDVALVEMVEPWLAEDGEVKRSRC